MADVDRGGARRDNGTRGRWARAAGLWAATSTAAVLGDVELARWGEQGNGRREGGRAKEGGRKYMGGPFVPGEATTRDKRTFCPGWWFHPGQKGLLGGPGKFLSHGPPLVPGRSTTRDKRGRFPSFPPNVMFVFVSFYFSFKIGFHLLIQLIKLWNKISYLYINLIHATKIINFHSSDWVNEISNFFEIIFVILTMQKYIR